MNSDLEGSDRHETLLDILVTLFRLSVQCPLLECGRVCLTGDLPILHAHMVTAQELWAKFTVKRHFTTESPCPLEMQVKEVEAPVLKGVSVLLGSGTLLGRENKGPT